MIIPSCLAATALPLQQRVYPELELKTNFRTNHPTPKWRHFKDRRKGNYAQAQFVEKGKGGNARWESLLREAIKQR